MATADTIDSLDEVATLAKKYSVIDDIRINVAQWWGEEAEILLADTKRIISKLQRARSNMGLAQTNFIAAGAAAAWLDEKHVENRRKIFTERLDFASEKLTEMGIKHIKPEATFYLWCEVPAKFAKDDVTFCLELAKKGVITSPSSWLGKTSKGFFRMAMVPDIKTTKKAQFINWAFE